MASPSLSSPLLPSARNPSSLHHCSSPLNLSHPFLSPPRLIQTARTSTLIAVYSPKVWDAKMVEETKRRIVEKYGDELAEFVRDEPSPKSRRQRKGRRRQAEESKETDKTEQDKPVRTTHRLLQVLGGKARRMKLLSPAGMDVRPMMEVVRGAAFGILQAAGGTPNLLRPGKWLDLYSGTGSVGIEAISRGCSEAHFVEMDPWVVSEVLRPNLEKTGFLEASVIHTKRVESFLEYAEKFTDKERSFDYISVTPPYTQVNYSTLMDQIARSPLVGEDCFILVEYPLETTLSDTCGNLVKIVDRRFGRTNLLIYGPTWAEKKKRKS